MSQPEPPILPPSAPPAAEPPGVPITPNMILYLKQTRPWVLFLSILGFVFAGLCFLGGAFMLLGSRFMQFAQPQGPFSGTLFMTIMGAVYLLMGVFYLIPCILLIRYSGGIGRMLRTDLAGGMEAALKHQKSFWKYLGILTLSFIILYIVGIFIFILFVVMRTFRGGIAA